MRRFRWVIMGMVFWVCMINYLDRSALSYAIHPLEQTFGLTNTDFGVIASGFGIGYLLMSFVGGILVDKLGARKVWTFFCTFWSIGCACIGLATGYGSIFIFRLILGLGEGPAFPALNRVSADWLPVKERARALAFALAAVPFASVIGAPVLSYMVVWLGWRNMFFILGSFGLIWSIVWVVLFRDKPSQNPFISQDELKFLQSASQAEICKNTTSWSDLLKNKTLWINNYAFFALGYLLFFAITWLPGYLEQTYHMQLKTIGWFLIAPWSTATLFTLLGGTLSDYLWNKTHNIRIARSHVIWVCQLLSALCFIPVIFTPSVAMVIFWISLGLGFGLMPSAAFYAINSDLAFGKAGTSQGITTASFALSGIIAPVVTGGLATFTGNFSIAIVVMLTLALSSAILIVLFQTQD